MLSMAPRKISFFSTSVWGGASDDFDSVAIPGGRCGSGRVSRAGARSVMRTPRETVGDGEAPRRGCRAPLRMVMAGLEVCRRRSRLWRAGVDIVSEMHEDGAGLVEPEAADLGEAGARRAFGEERAPVPGAGAERLLACRIHLGERLAVAEEGGGFAGDGGFVDAGAVLGCRLPGGGECLGRIDDGAGIAEERERLREGDVLAIEAGAEADDGAGCGGSDGRRERAGAGLENQLGSGGGEGQGEGCGKCAVSHE